MQENLSFRPATPGAHPPPGSLITVHHCLTYEEDKASLLDRRMEDHSSEEDVLAHCLPSIAEEDEDDAEGHFHTA